MRVRMMTLSLEEGEAPAMAMRGEGGAWKEAGKEARKRTLKTTKKNTQRKPRNGKKPENGRSPPHVTGGNLAPYSKISLAPFSNL